MSLKGKWHAAHPEAWPAAYGPADSSPRWHREQNLRYNSPDRFSSPETPLNRAGAPVSSCVSASHAAYVCPSSPSHVSWMFRIIPAFVYMRPDFTRSSWYRWHSPHPFSHTDGAEGFFPPNIDLCEASLASAFGSPPWQDTQDPWLAEAVSIPLWHDSQVDRSAAVRQELARRASERNSSRSSGRDAGACPERDWAGPRGGFLLDFINSLL